MRRSMGPGPASYNVKSTISDSFRAHWMPVKLLHTGESIVDLACGDVVRVKQSTERLRWAGDTFYFCSPICRHRFAAAPAAFFPARDD